MRRMIGLTKPTLTNVARGISNAVVLCLLLGLTYWGHEHRWKMPRFSELISSGPHAGDAEPGAGAGDTTGGAASHRTTYRPDLEAAEGMGGPSHATASTGRVRSPIANNRPVVTFATADAVRDSGLRMETAQRRALCEFRVANGVVDYDHTRMARLSSRVPGVVLSVERRAGDSVKRGDVLALIDSADVGRAKAAFLEAVVMHDLKWQTLQRLKLLPDTISKRRVEEAEADWNAATIHRFNAQQALINMGLPIQIENVAKLSLEDLGPRIQFLGLPEELAASIRSQTLSANLIPLVSSIEGVIVSRDAVMGEMVKPSEPLFVVADIRQMYLQLDVRAEDINDLMIGQSVTFQTDGCRDDVPGTLNWIGTEVDPRTRTVQVRAEVSNPILQPASGNTAARWLLHAHAYGTARIRVREKSDALTVRSSAVQRSWHIDTELVFVPSPDGLSFEPRNVTLGMKQGNFIEILDGLKEGETVVTDGSRLLQSELGRDVPVAVGSAAK